MSTTSYTPDDDEAYEQWADQHDTRAMGEAVAELVTNSINLPGEPGHLLLVKLKAFFSGGWYEANFYGADGFVDRHRINGHYGKGHELVLDLAVHYGIIPAFGADTQTDEDAADQEIARRKEGDR